MVVRYTETKCILAKSMLRKCKTAYINHLAHHTPASDLTETLLHIYTMLTTLPPKPHSTRSYYEGLHMTQRKNLKLHMLGATA